jgi:glutamyl/glutaminyl-tRNA synthetase
MSVEDLARAVEPRLIEAGLPVPDSHEYFNQLLELLRPRARRLGDFMALARPFLVDTVEYEQDAIDKHLSAPDLGPHVAALVTVLRGVTPFDESHVEAAVRGLAAERGIKSGVLIHATRVAVTGRMTSPGLFEVLELLGRERTVSRLEQLVSFLFSRV